MSEEVDGAMLHHDLGKAIVFTQRWLASTATFDERCEAVKDDVLRTRRGPTGSVGAIEIWKSFCSSSRMEPILLTEHGKRLEGAMCQLEQLVDKLSENINEELLEKVVDICWTVNEACKALKAHEAYKGEM